MNCPFRFSSQKSFITAAMVEDTEVQRAIVSVPQNALPSPFLRCGACETQERQSRLIESALDELHAERTYKTRPMLFDSLTEQKIPLCHFSVMPLFPLSWELAIAIETMSDLIFVDVETVICEYLLQSCQAGSLRLS